MDVYVTYSLTMLNCGAILVGRVSISLSLAALTNRTGDLMSTGWSSINFHIKFQPSSCSKKHIIIGCHLSCQSLVVSDFVHYLCSLYWAISTQYDNWACHRLAIWPDIWPSGLYVICPITSLLYNNWACRSLATHVFRNHVLDYIYVVLYYGS